MTDRSTPANPEQADYAAVHTDIVELLESARRAAARSVNALMTASYWEIGRRIVEFEQSGQARAARGQQLLRRLAKDLGQRFGRGFNVDNLEQMRLFFLAYPPQRISETLSRNSSKALATVEKQTRHAGKGQPTPTRRCAHPGRNHQGPLRSRISESQGRILRVRP